MKLRYLFCAILISAFTILENVNIAKGGDLKDWPTAPIVSSECAILMDADTGAVLYEKNAYERAFPSNLTKLMTALLTFENCNMQDTVVFSYDSTHCYAPGESNIGIWYGERLTVEQTLRGILMESANEACYGIGEFISGDIDSFVELMNKRAVEIGAKDTNFVNSNGLHNNNHYSTCYDIAMIGRACLDNKSFITITSDTKSYNIPPTNKYKTDRYLRNKHAMLKNRDNYYEYSLGGIPGYSEAAGYTLVSFAEKNGVKLICVVMRSTNNHRYEDTLNLFEYGFNNFEKTAITNDTLNSFISDTNNTFTPDNFFEGNNYTLKLSENMYALLPIGADPKDITARATFTEKGFADITFSYNSHDLASAKLEVSSDTSQDTSNLPLLNTNNSITKTPKEYTVINIWYLVIIFGIVVVIVFVASYYLIMNKTEYGQNKKRARRRRRH